MTKIDVCNMALGYLNVGRIKSLEEDAAEAKLCDMYYDMVRKRILRMYSWGFARRTEKLTRVRTLLPGWAYVYAYPARAILVRFVFDAEHAREREMHRQEFYITQLDGTGLIIGSDVEHAWAEYTMDKTEVSTMPVEFINALSHMLASEMAMTLTGNTELMNIHLQLARAAIDTAKHQDAVEGERETLYPQTYANARFS
ncbi:hypothetical protein TAMA11512_12900 [Selenomonas sp. TAMA-11512]|uniref:hypothetical protein n=1 Tax=Selenomonas sp. TAMA-11512 TaxID=3095337 RepID=UPI00308D0A4E|nr:hypothetical protein TAMA11512_12900 [Selenomonas sp. TAMA-11512]